MVVAHLDYSSSSKSSRTQKTDAHRAILAAKITTKIPGILITKVIASKKTQVMSLLLTKGVTTKRARVLSCPVM